MILADKNKYFRNHKFLHKLQEIAITGPINHHIRNLRSTIPIYEQVSGQPELLLIEA